MRFHDNCFYISWISLTLLVSFVLPRRNEISHPPTSQSHRPNFVPSGQTMRLRGNSSRQTGSGRIEVYLDGRWRSICGDSFNIRDAHVICRQLGFTRGAQEVKPVSAFGHGNLGFIAADNLRCTGPENSIFQCPRSRKVDCSSPSGSAGVTCRLNDPSKCEPDEILFKNKCYFLSGKIKMTFSAANQHCRSRRRDSSLLVVQTQEENDFLSEAIFAAYLQFDGWYTAGYRSRGHAWTWKVVRAANMSSFSKWRPNIKVDRKLKCLILRHNIRDLSEKDYYYWDAATCNFYRPFICEAPPKNIGSWTLQRFAPINNNVLTIPRSEPWIKLGMASHNPSNNMGSSQSIHKRSKRDIGIDLEASASAYRQGAEMLDLSSLDFLTSGGTDWITSSFGEHFKINRICGQRFVKYWPKSPRKKRQTKVIRGMTVQKGAYPWTAGIRKLNRHHCGASIVSERYLITAAHCFDDDSNLSHYEVVAGDRDNAGTDGTEQVFKIERIIKHPSYINYRKDDIAILKLKPKSGKGLKFSKFIQPVCLPSKNANDHSGLKCVVSGWGRTKTGYPRHMQAALVPIIARSSCTHSDVYGSRIARKAFCAGFLSGGIDACQGDSGGPYVCKVDDKFRLYGIVSWGDGCARRNKPTVYTKVSDYLDWIQKNI